VVREEVKVKEKELALIRKLEELMQVVKNVPVEKVKRKRV
jgi:hypothetical protein